MRLGVVVMKNRIDRRWNACVSGLPAMFLDRDSGCVEEIPHVCGSGKKKTRPGLNKLLAHQGRAKKKRVERRESQRGDRGDRSEKAILSARRLRIKHGMRCQHESRGQAGLAMLELDRTESKHSRKNKEGSASAKAEGLTVRRCRPYSKLSNGVLPIPPPCWVSRGRGGGTVSKSAGKTDPKLPIIAPGSRRKYYVSCFFSLPCSSFASAAQQDTWDLGGG